MFLLVVEFEIDKPVGTCMQPHKTKGTIQIHYVLVYTDLQ